MSSRAGRRGVMAAVASLALLAGMAAVPANAAGEARQRFIITVADAYDSRAVAGEHRRNGTAIDFVYTAALNGFAGAMSEADLGRLQRDGRVTRIERDGVVTTSETTQANATWGLDRIDQRALPLSTTYAYNSTGSGVSAYIIDTGIRTTHTDFGGRAVSGYDAVDGGTADDCNGHGTHVAGTVGGAAYGVAKAATLVAVRVLDCAGSGSWSGVIAGLDWVAANRVKPAVANMSLGGGASASVDDAVNRTIAAGVSVVVAAGNGNRAGIGQDACNYSPARVAEAITIGATTSTDAKTSFSNYGSCVDLFAPGASIMSAWYESDTQTKTISGTSMAAPHVAGVAALYLQDNPLAEPTAVRNGIYDASTKGIVTSSKTANNHLLYSLLDSGTVIENGTLSGTVTTTDSAGSMIAVADAVVSVSTTSTITKTDGSYTLSLAPDTYEVTVTSSGYDTATATVMIDSSTTTTQNFSLTKSSTSAEPAPSIGLTLSAGKKVKGTTPVTSSWSDSDTGYSGTYTVFVNGSPHETVEGTFETTSWKGSGTLTYQVCRSGTNICSATQSITI